MGDYVVIREWDASRPGSASLEPRFGPLAREAAIVARPASGGGASAQARRLRLEKENLTKSEAADLAKDPTVKGVARLMPTALVRPLQVAAGAGPADGPAANRDGCTWGVKAVRADTSCCSGQGVKVAVLDTGIDLSQDSGVHPAFIGLQVVQRDFTEGGAAATVAPDTVGHGTHCTGTLCGRSVDGLRIGVAPGVDDLLIGKVLGPGGGDTRMLYDGLQWAVANGANIISMSLGFDFPGMVDRLVKDDGWGVQQATSRALDAYRQNIRMFDKLVSSLNARPDGDGVVIVAATGNESLGGPKPVRLSAGLPAASEGVLAVAALEAAPEGLKTADFSNSLARFAAPGVDILSAANGGGLRRLSGTSMATPHVAGVAALWWERLAEQPAVGEITLAERVRNKLISSVATDILAAGFDPADVGYGVVQAPQA